MMTISKRITRATGETFGLEVVDEVQKKKNRGEVYH